MGNTKSYYVEGELLSGKTLEEFRSVVHSAFRETYLVAEIVEPSGGYLGGDDGSGAYLLAAIHSFSTGADSGIGALVPLFKNFRMHRVDSDWSDCWITFYDDSEGLRTWKAHSSTWAEEQQKVEGPRMSPAASAPQE